jgi:hypothetical protein
LFDFIPRGSGWGWLLSADYSDSRPCAVSALTAPCDQFASIPAINNSFLQEPVGHIQKVDWMAAAVVIRVVLEHVDVEQHGADSLTPNSLHARPSRS